MIRAYDYTCPLLLGDVPDPGVRPGSTIMRS
jgi:hypothetical protein